VGHDVGVDPIVVVGVLAVGFASGVLSGMFGVGGAVLTTPGLRILGASPIESIGSTIPAIIPGAITGAWHYARAGLVDWRIALTCGIVGSATAVVGANVSDLVNAHYLMLLTAAMLLWGGQRNLRPASAPAPERELVAVGAVSAPVGPVEVASPDVAPQRLVRVVLIGAGAGFVAGLLGIGGGVLMVPAFTGLLRLSPKRAVGSSLASVAIFSVPAMVRHAQLGHISWAFALLLVIGVIPGARFGARFTLNGSDRRLQLLMGLFFTVLALSYGFGELRSL
jgi:uncharacterized membrane protein YfcA